MMPTARARCFASRPSAVVSHRLPVEATYLPVITASVIVSVLWHAWVGVRNVWMDYVPAAGLRFTLQSLTVVWLVGCAAWGFEVLWRI